MSPSGDAGWVQASELRGPPFAPLAGPESKLIVFGAVPLAAALCRLAPAAGRRAYVCDPRTRFATAERFPGAEAVLAAWPEPAFAQAGGIDQATAVLALAHDPVLDDPALLIALRSPAVYVGAMGSRRTQAARRERLAEAGLSEAELTRLSGPAGLDLGARTVVDTALSILAEIVAVGHGHAGGRLSAAQGPIHREAAA